MCIELGYPDPRSERALLEGRDRRGMLAALSPRMTVGELQSLQRQVEAVHCAAPVIDYVQALLAWTRTAPSLAEGLSPRAGLGIVHAARAWALLDGRDHVLPDDVQAVLPSVAGHRLRPAGRGAITHRARTELVAAVVEAVAVP